MFSEEPPSDAELARGNALNLLRVILAVAAPAVIAMFAVMAGYGKTAAVYFILAVSLTCWMGAQESVRDLFDPPSVEVENPGNDHCVPISGSDRTCPGG